VQRVLNSPVAAYRLSGYSPWLALDLAQQRTAIGAITAPIAVSSEKSRRSRHGSNYFLAAAGVAKLRNPSLWPKRTL